MIHPGRFNADLVPGCPEEDKDSSTIWRHFSYLHAQAELTVTREFNEWCTVCSLFTENVETHPQTATCDKIWRCHYKKVAIKQASAEDFDFFINGEPIKRVHWFQYLGRILLEKKDDMECINKQLKKDWQRWSLMERILKQEGSNVHTMSTFYTKIVQAVLWYGLNLWTS